MTKSRILPLLAAICIATSAAADDFVPFVIPGKPNPDSLIAAKSAEPITTGSPRLTTRGESFIYKGEPVRLWGVNLSFNASMPTHADAPNIAARLAQMGVNTVRIHHLDTSRWPRGIWDSSTGADIEPQALDRLDYFINELAKQGIWANFNLHVGRAHSGYLNLPKANTSYDKIVGIFTPALIDAQKDYARKILTHVNKYRGVTYADDPALAIFEITNEDSFFMWSGDKDLRALPEFYTNLLQARFNTWLRKRYGTNEGLKSAWSRGEQALGANLVKNSDFSDASGGSSLTSWSLGQHSGCKASLSLASDSGRRVLTLAPITVDETDWHLQFSQGNLSLIRDRYYTLTFEAAAVEKPRRISLVVSQNHDPWRSLGFSRSMDLTTDLRQYKFGFTATDSDINARISFSFGKDSGAIRLANIRIHPGGMIGLHEGESLNAGSVVLYPDSESPARASDRMVFLAETEKAYFDSMRNFIKRDLASRALVTGTIVFGPLGLYGQSDMDFIDSHAYWQHPRFPNRPWDQGDWLVSQKPMTDFPDEATLFRLAAERLAGKPYTVSEYNHPAPLNSQAETVPMMASFAAAQGWSGIWFYSYSHDGSNPYRQALSSFFDIDSNPAKWGFMRAGASIFLDTGIRPFNRRIEYAFGGSEPLARLAGLHLKYDRNMLAVSGVEYEQLLTAQLLAGGGATKRLDLPGSSDTTIRWSVDSGKGIYAAEDSGATAYSGHAEKYAVATNNRISVSSPEFAALTITSLDNVCNHSLDQSSRILITACGRCENVGMEFSQDRQTVGRKWGRAPVQIEAVDARVTLPPGKWTCKALTAEGTVSTDVPVEYDGDTAVVHLLPKYKTMWYLATAAR